MLSQNLYDKTQDVGKKSGLLIKNNILYYYVIGATTKLNKLASYMNF